jgi:hypothetical protein
MSTHAYTRTATDGLWDLYPYPLASAIEVALPAKQFVVRATGADVSVAFNDALSPGEITTLDASVEAARVAPNALVLLKEKRMVEIDARTVELIFQGFAHAGKVFSLSLPAQSYWTNMYLAKDILTAQGAFPLKVNTLNDLDAHNIADAVEVTTFYATAVGTVKARLGSGTVLKDAIRAATTIAEVNAVVDTR